MVSRTADTVDAYLDALPPERQEDMKTMRALLQKSLPAGYEEGMGFGMISYFIPLSRYPTTYNGQPLCIAALASHKQHMSLYLMGVYGDAALAERFEREYKASGKKLDVGKSCLRFKSVEDVATNVVANALASVPVAAHIAKYEAVKGKPAAKKKPAPAAKKSKARA